MSEHAADRPTISVVVAVFNALDVLPRCLDSVLSQEDGSIEVVVVDGASTDGTVECLERYGERLGFWMSEPDAGVYSAWNKAIDHVRGDWICFLGADDRLAGPTVVTDMEPHLAPRPERVVYGLTHVVDDKGVRVGTMGAPWPETQAALPKGMSLPNPSTFYHRDLFGVHGRFDERFRIAGDYEFLLRELTDRDAHFANVLVTIMGAGGLSQDPKNRPASLREAAWAREQNGLRTPRFHRSVEIVEAHGYAGLHRAFGSDRGERLWGKYQSLLRRARRERR